MSAGALPQTPLGSLQRSSNPLADFKPQGAASRQKANYRGRGWEGREGLGEGKRERRVRGNRGMGEGREKREVGGIAPWLLGDRRPWFCRYFRSLGFHYSA